MAGLGLLTKRRLLYLLGIFTLLITVLIVRLAWIQIVNGEWYQKKAFQQQNLERVINPKRGMITDRNLKPLAVSASAETISVNPQALKISGRDTDMISQKLSEILKMDKAKVLKLITAKNRYQIVKKKIDKSLGDEVRQWVIDQKLTNCIFLDEDTKRYYPYNNLASHVIGFTGSDNQGLDGMEAVMEQYLKGVPGRIMSEADARGNSVPFSEEKHIDPQDGLNVVLTIDETIQAIAEKELETAIADNKAINGGEVIVMDPRNGDILALASKPDFDLNNPWAAPQGIDPSTWNPNDSKSVETLFKTVWRDKAVADSYEPGSTFKAFTSAAGLEEGVIHPNDQVTDLPVKVGGWTIKCWRSKPHGAETFTQGVYNSCNPVFVRVAQALGINRFYKYVKNFGFYDKTGISLPGEDKGITHSKPTEVDMATASFGQSFTVTPIQLITAYGAIANGGTLMKPRLVKELTDSNGKAVKTYDPVSIRRVISKETADTLKSILEGVVSQGTGENAYVKGYRVAGKTGTAETVESRKGTQRRYIASFSAIAPADDPRLCVLIVLDYPTGPFGHMGGAIAAPVAGKIVEQSLEYLGVDRRYTEKDKETMVSDVYVPETRSQTVENAKRTLAQYGLDFKVEGTGGDIVLDQLPKPDAVIPEKSVVILYTNETQKKEDVKMPDLTGQTIAQATKTLNDLGLNIKAEGVGIVVKQTVAPGAIVKKGDLIEIEFRLMDLDE
ncbi:MAG: penicillin-binding transpeptidase domain-containing protein [Bacillota bacterium]|nr:penicillin-binding transpeptidase domain-containing protein [Bacillota bacterium]